MIWVREPGTAAPRPLAEGGEPLGREGALSTSERGPFAPASEALQDARLRDALARVLQVPSLRHRGALRAVVGASAALGCTLFVVARTHEIGSVIAALILASAVVRELTHRAPEIPRTAAAALVALGLEEALRVLATCGRAATLPALGAGSLLVGGLLLLAVSPGRLRVVLDFAGRLGLERADVVRGEIAAHHPRGKALHAGLALAIALVGGDRALLRAGLALARCTGRLDAGSAAELARDDAAHRALLERVRHGVGPLLAYVVAYPIASEVLRMALLFGLSRRLRKETSFLVASALYAVLNTVLLGAPLTEGLFLGLAFAVTLAEGSLLAAIGAHVAYRWVTLL